MYACTFCKNYIIFTELNTFTYDCALPIISVDTEVEL